MNDDLNNFDFDGLYIDPSTGNLLYNCSLLKYQQSGISYGAANYVGGEILQVDETSQLRKLLDNLENTEAEEYIDIVIEFLRRRLEKVLDNPDMVDNLDKLRKLDSLDLANRVLYLEDKVNNLMDSLSDVTARLDKLLTILKNGQEEIRDL